MGRKYWFAIAAWCILMVIFLPVESTTEGTSSMDLGNGTGIHNISFDFGSMTNMTLDINYITNFTMLEDVKKQCYEQKQIIDSQMKEYKALEETMAGMDNQMHEYIDQMMAMFHAMCDIVNNFKLTNLTVENAVSWIVSAKDNADSIYKVLDYLEPDTIKDIMKDTDGLLSAMDPTMSGVASAIGEKFIESSGGARYLTLDDIKDMGKSAVYLIPPYEIKDLPDTVFEYLIDQMANATKIVLDFEIERMSKYTDCSSSGQCENIDQQHMTNDSHSGEHINEVEVDHSLLFFSMIQRKQTARLKAICQKLFQLYSTSSKLNTDIGWHRVKYLMFCAPSSICQKIDPAKVVEDIKTLSFLPWTCGRTIHLGDEPFVDTLRTIAHLFPSNKACGMMLVSKIFFEKNSEPLYSVTSVDDMKSLNQIALCVADKKMMSLIDVIGCDLGLPILEFGAFSKRINNYAARKCMTLPQNYDNITCSVLSETYGPFLSSMKMKFFKNLNKTVLCNSTCISSFTNYGIPDYAMQFIMNKCYGDEAILSADAVASLGPMVTDLSVDKFDQISAADLASSLDSIKSDLKQSGRKGKGKKRAVMGKLARKMISDGKISSIVDSPEIMQHVSLKELKSTLSTSDNLLTDLGIGNSSDVAMTDSQKKWVVKELMKTKSSDSMTLDDIQGMAGLVTGMLSSDIEQIGEANRTDSELLEFAEGMCKYNNWPTKSLRAINKHLIRRALEYRNSTNPMSALTMLDVQAIGCECFMHFSATDYNLMEEDICSSVCQKIGYCSTFRCLNTVRRKNTLQACLKCKGLGSNVMSKDDISELGPSLISQMSSKQLSLVPKSVFISELQYIKEMCLNKALREAVGSTIVQTIGNEGSDYTTDILYLLGSAIRLLPTSVQQRLDKTALAEMSASVMNEIFPKDENEIRLMKCCEQWHSSEDLAHQSQLDMNLMMTIKQALFAGADVSSRRKKRSNSGWTCSFIRNAPDIFYTATEEEITSMDDAEFSECLTDIGQLTDYTTSQKDALLAKAKIVLSETNVCNMLVTDIVSLGSVLTSLTTSDIDCLPLDDGSLVTTIGSTGGWSDSQLTAIASRYLSANSLTDLSGMTDSDIALLGPVLCGFDASLVTTIPSLEIGESGTVVGALKCDVAILTELATLAMNVNAFGPVSGWGAAEVAEFNYLIAGLSGTEIVDLTVEAIEGLDPTVIPEIPAAVLNKLTATHFESFTDAQATAVTQSQLDEMSEEQTTILKEQSTGGEAEVPELQMTDESGKANGLFSLVDITVTLLFMMLSTTLVQTFTFTT